MAAPTTAELTAQLVDIEADLGIRATPKRTVPRHRATPQGVAAWTLHYEGKTADAHSRVVGMRRHGIPKGHIDEYLGAVQSLTPVADRCPHWGDRTYCPQCREAEKR